MSNNKLLDFLLDKKKKGLPLNVGEAMSKTDTWIKGNSAESCANIFRVHWEKNNK